MQPSQNALIIIKQFEGFRASPYLDSVGVCTIGYGSTTENGIAITMAHPPITEQQASNLLMQYVLKSTPAINSLLTHQITQNQFDAITSFVYNLGIGNFGSSTLLKKLNAWDILGSADEFLKWNRAGAQVLAGLTNRRTQERALFLK